jgi:diguanylate cyclase (GGDEF)-like protein
MPIVGSYRKRRYQPPLMQSRTPIAAVDPPVPVVGRDALIKAIDDTLRDPGRNGNGALIEVALDNLAFVNASHGWAVGDRLIATVGGALRAAIPAPGTVGQLRSERFGILLSDAQPGVVDGIAEMVTELVRGCRVDAGHRAIGTTASVGVVPFAGRSLSAEEALLEADLATRSAKSRGRNCAARADARLRESLETSLAWAEQIREAVAADGFTLLAQPIRRPASDSVHAWELLVRLRPRSGELIPPAQFFPIAERFGLMEQIDRWVTRQAIRLAQRRRQGSTRLVIHVNVASKSVQSGEFATFVSDEIAAAGVDPASLTFEIAEATAVDAAPATERVGQALRELGCRLLLDNFGVGYASLVHLRELPLDLVKIDGAFVRHLAASAMDQAAVDAVTRLAHASGLEVVAAFVPDDVVARMLQEFGVDYIQGFHVGRQVPVAELP